ncbi:kinase-like domain-containing protein, partial [Mycena crocata]
FWRDHQVWLERCGYMLRPRFRPGWVPSWIKTKEFQWMCEDGVINPGHYAIDAIRMRDNVSVQLKNIDSQRHDIGQEVEIEIVTYFFSGSLYNDPRNHCVPILEILDVPGEDHCKIMVMPLLREYNHPRFDTFGEAVDFFSQIFEGLKFLHDHNVAHRDCNGMNIMMDGCMFPDGFHGGDHSKTLDFSKRARHFPRTQHPPKYYFIDFGISRMYATRNPPPLEVPILGGDKSAPECIIGAPCDPFPTDIYYLGNLIHEEFIEDRLLGFEFMKPLVADMVAEDPAKRPTIEEVIKRFSLIQNGLSSWKLRSRVVKAEDQNTVFHRSIAHWYHRIGYILRRVPAVPKRTSS